MKRFTFKRHRILITLIFLLAIVGVFSYGNRNLLPSTTIIEIIFFALIALYAGNLKYNTLTLNLFLLIYLLYFHLSAYENSVNILDVLVSTKSLIYIGCLSLIVYNRAIKLNYIIIFFQSLLILFLIKYGYTRLLSVSERPIVFTENNYELLVLILLAAGLWQLRGYTLWQEVLALLAIVGLAGSRSGVLELLFMLLVAARFSGMQSNIRFKLISFLALLAITLPLVFFTISSRFTAGDTLEDIDRFKFLMVFISETKDWPIQTWIFGAKPLTHLSKESCQTLSYYIQLFSYSGNGTCYSIVLHSMLLRAVFDHGVFGLLFILTTLWILLTKNGFDTKVKSAILGVLIINGTSVSSFNSVYAVLPIALLFVTIRDKHLNINATTSTL